MQALKLMGGKGASYEHCFCSVNTNPGPVARLQIVPSPPGALPHPHTGSGTPLCSQLPVLPRLLGHTVTPTTFLHGSSLCWPWRVSVSSGSGFVLFAVISPGAWPWSWPPAATMWSPPGTSPEPPSFIQHVLCAWGGERSPGTKALAVNPLVAEEQPGPLPLYFLSFAGRKLQLRFLARLLPECGCLL